MRPSTLKPLLQELLNKALTAYGIQTPRQVHFNVKQHVFLFRIHTDSAVFALKIYPQHLSLAQRLPEIANWISHLSDSPEHRFIKALPNRQQRLISTIFAGKRHWCAVLYPWISGQDFPEQLTPQHIYQWGSLLGAFHAQSAQLKDKFLESRLNTWNTVFYASTPERLMKSSFWEQLSAPHTGLNAYYQEQVRTVQDTLHELWRNAEPPLRIHSDMQGPNIICQIQQWTLLDFDDLTWGYPVQDLAIALLPLRTHSAFKSLYAHFKAGYQRLSPWPEAHEAYLDKLMTARLLVLADALLDNKTLVPSAVLEHWVHYGQKMQAITNAPSPDGPSL